MDMNQIRRSVLGTIGAVAAVAGTVGFSSTSVFGASDGPQLVFVEIDDEDEYLVVKNTSGEEMDLGGYVVDFGFKDDDEGDEQKGTIDQGTTIGPGETLKIAPDAGKGEAGVVTDREYVMPNDEEEVYAILSPEGTVVARSDQDTAGSDTTTTESEETTTTESEETTTEDETTTEEETTTEDDSEESTSDETTDDSNGDESSGDSSEDTQSDDDSESDGNGESENTDSEESSSEGDSEDDC